MMNGWRRAALAGAVSLLFLPGCLVRSLIDGEKGQKGILSPDIIKVTVPTDPPKPAVKEALPQPPAPEVPKAAPPVDQKLLPRDDQGRPPLNLVSSTATSESSVRLSVAKSSRFSAPDLTVQDVVITEDTLFQGDVLIIGSVTVAPQATVTVSPGARLRFRPSEAGDAALLVQGRLIVQGTVERPAVFTGDGRDAAPGDWQGIIILGSTKKNTFENAVVDGAVTGIDAISSNLFLKGVKITGCLSGLSAVESVITISGGGVSGCQSGIHVIDGDFEMSGTSISGNGVGVSCDKAGVYISSGDFAGNRDTALSLRASRVKIGGTAFTGNGTGISFEGSEGEMTGSVVRDNRESGIRINGARIRVSGNEIRRNGGDGIVVDDARSTFWGNILADNGKHDIYNAGSGDVRAYANWWGGVEPRTRIFDRRDDSSRGTVMYLPVLKNKPPVAVGGR